MSTSLSKTVRLATRCELHNLRRCVSNRTSIHLHDDTQPLQSNSTPSPRTRRPGFSRPQACRLEAATYATNAPAKKSSETAKQSKMQKMKEQAMREGNIPEDVGLIKGTFVMPLGKNRPNWLSNYKDRMLLERKRLWTRLFEVGGAFIYRYWYIRPRPRLHVKRIPGVAKELHTSMYEHLASGDLQAIESSICSGMMGSLRGRIAQRPPGTRLKWTLHKYITDPKLASFKAVLLPSSRGETAHQRKGLVQAVVRIHSLQSLQHVKRVPFRGTNGAVMTRDVIVDASGRDIPGDPEQVAMRAAKELVEYVVVQKTLRNSKEGPWKLWGLTEEVKIDKLKREEREKEAKGEKAESTTMLGRVMRRIWGDNRGRGVKV